MNNPNGSIQPEGTLEPGIFLDRLAIEVFTSGLSLTSLDHPPSTNVATNKRMKN